MPRGKYSIPLVLAIFLASCTKPPPIPTLDRFPENPDRRLLLDDSLSVADYRSIFKAINQAGRLENIQRFFEGSTDEELTKLGQTISRHFYESAHDPNGALRCLKRRISDRSFSTMRDRLARWAGSPHALEEREALFHIASDTAVAGHLSLFREFFSSRWRDLARNVAREASHYEERLDWEEARDISAKEWLDDAVKFLKSNGRQRLIDLTALSLKQQLGPMAAQGFRRLKEQKGSEGFEGLGHGLAGLLPAQPGAPNTLQKLLELAFESSRASDGIFLAIEEKFKREPDYIHEFANNFKALAARGVVGFLRELLTSKRPETDEYYSKRWWERVADRKPNGEPGDGFVELFIAVRTAIERITGPVRNERLAPDAFLHNLPIYTNAFAITRWFEALIAENRETPYWKAEAEAKFHERILSLRLKSPKVSLDLAAPAAAGQLSPAQEMEAIGLKDFSQPLQQIIGTAQFGNFIYAFEPARETTTLHESLATAVKKADDVRPFADTGAFIRAVIYPLTRPQTPQALSFQSLETPNMLASVHRMLSIVSLDSWRKVKRLLFEDLLLLRLDDPQFDTRKLLLNLFDHTPPLKKRVAALFDRVPAIYELDKQVRGLPSPFEAYHAALSSIAPTRMQPFGDWLAHAGSERWLAETAEGAPQYPALRKLVAAAKPLAKGAFGLSVLDGFDAHLFFRPLEIASGENGNGFARLFPSVEQWLTSHRRGLERLLERALHDTDSLPFGGAVSDAELDWVGRLVRDDDHLFLIRYFQGHLTRESAFGAVRELKRLSKSGALRDGLRILSELDNDRIHEVAVVLLEWERNSELYAFLEGLEIWLR